MKQLAAQVVTYISKAVQDPLPLPVLKVLVPMLVNGTREKNTVVRSHSETAMVNLLQLRQGDTTLQVQYATSFSVVLYIFIFC